jgi:hypothetical protein
MSAFCLEATLIGVPNVYAAFYQLFPPTQKQQGSLLLLVLCTRRTSEELQIILPYLNLPD